MSSQLNSQNTLNTFVLKDLAKRELVDLLDTVNGKKAIVIDPSLSGPLSLIAEFSLLKEHGVDKIYQLQAQKLPVECNALIYICRPIRELMLDVAKQIKANPDVHHYLYFVPRRSMICEKVLEEEGVYGDVTIGEYHLDAIPLEEDVLSMELDDAFCQLFVDGDVTLLYDTAKAILKLQTIFGVIPRIVGKGFMAQKLLDTLLRMRKEVLANTASFSSTAIFPTVAEYDSMIILDRTVDLVTLMCTQLTYEGLVDEYFGNNSGFVEVDPSYVGSAPQQSTTGGIKKKKVLLNDQDALFRQIRDVNFAVVGQLLSQHARRIQENYDGRHQAKSVTEIKEFVGNLGNLQQQHRSLKLHTSLAEDVAKRTNDVDFNRMLELQQNFVAGMVQQQHVEYLEELLYRQQDENDVLRLIALMSLVQGGLKPKQYDYFRKEILQTYGFENLKCIDKMEKVGLLRKMDTNRTVNPYGIVRKLLRIIVDDVDEQNPNDPSYVYSGYAPISVRLVQAACTKSVSPSTPPSYSLASWRGFEDAIRALPGGVGFEDLQKATDGSSIPISSNKRTLVVFLGGCTHTEISALRFLSQRDSRSYTILTTNILTGKTLLQDLQTK